MGDVPAGAALAVPARLSQVLTAFIIECDNEFEQRMPHRTTRHGSSGDLRHPPWLVSMAMWANCLRFVPPGGIAAGELARRARLARPSMDLVLTRMSQWWGYLAAPPGTAAARLVTPTRAGQRAREIWAPLPGEIEERWRQRFGPAVIAGLRSALVPAAGRAGRLPDFLPVGQAEPDDGPSAGGPSASGLALPELLSKVLLALALDFERESGLALGVHTSRGAARLEISANVLRVLDDGETQVRDIPAASGVAQMTIGNWLGSLAEHRYLSTGADPGGGRYKVAALTPRGRAARDAYRRWAAADGGLPEAPALRAALRPLHDDLLAGGTEPYPDGWRAKVARPATLPHYPVISPRGGFPDGS